MKPTNFIGGSECCRKCGRKLTDQSDAWAGLCNNDEACARRVVDAMKQGATPMASKKTKKPPTEAAITKAQTEPIVVENATHWERAPSAPPHLVIDSAGLDIIRDMMRNGHDRAAIATALQTNTATLSQCIKRQPEVEAAMQQGRSALHTTIFSALLEQGLAGYAPALMFLAKCRLGWRETDTQESRPNIQLIKLPDSRSPEEYLKALLTDGAEVKAK